MTSANDRAPAPSTPLELPPEQVMNAARWQRELDAFARHGAVVTRTATQPRARAGRARGHDRPGNDRISSAKPEAPHFDVRVRWPVLHDAGEQRPHRHVPREMALQIRFGCGYPWFSAQVRCPGARRWLPRHCNPADGMRCLTGHDPAPGSRQARDHDPSEPIADLIARQLPRLIEANFTPTPAIGLEDQIGEGIGTWLPQTLPVLLLDSSLIPPLTAQPGSTESERDNGSSGVLVMTPLATGVHGFLYLSVAAVIDDTAASPGTTSGGASGRLVLTAPVLELIRSGASNGAEVQVGENLQLRIARLPWVRLSTPLRPSDLDDLPRLWEIAASQLRPAAEPAVRGLDRLVRHPGCTELLLALVPDEVARRTRGLTPVLLVRTRADRRRRWHVSVGTVQLAGPSDLTARHPLPPRPGADRMLTVSASPRS